MEKPESEKEKLITLKQAAQTCGVERQAIYVAVRNGRIPAKLVKNKFYITQSGLEEYLKTKYSREDSNFNGTPVYDVENGLCSVNHISKIFGISRQMIYYRIRTGDLKSIRKGIAHVIDINEARQIFQKMEIVNIQQLRFA